MPILLGLLASVLIGSSDFLGGRTAGRTTPLQTTTAAFLGGAVAVLAISPFLGTAGGRDLALGAASGVAVFAALTLLWWGYARSSIGVAAPMAAVVSTALPVLYDAARGEVPGALGWTGIAIGLAALVLTSWVPRGSGLHEDVRVGVVLGALAGVAFATMFVIAASSSEESGTWPVAAQRATAFAIAAGVGLARGRRPLAGGASLRWGLLAGVFGAGGVAAVVYAGQRGPFAPIVVAGSMYPAVAVALAWVFMRQTLRAGQIVGLAAAILGVSLIALD